MPQYHVSFSIPQPCLTPSEQQRVKAAADAAFGTRITEAIARSGGLHAGAAGEGHAGSTAGLSGGPAGERLDPRGTQLGSPWALVVSAHARSRALRACR